MPTSRLLLLALVVLAVPARAQAPLTLVDRDTQVKTVTFDFVNGQTLFEQDLELQVATTPRPGVFARTLLGGGGEDYPFNPIELARDVVRLTRYYETSGFPQAEVDYAVELDTARNAVDVTFLIDEGPPLVIGDVEFRGPGQSDVTAVLAPDIRDDWEAFTRRTAVRTGGRLSLFSLVELQGQTISWLRNRGYAWADAGAEQFPDSTGLTADVRVKVNVGDRVRVRSVRVEGNESLDASTVAREIPIAAGDLFDASALSEGQREIFGLGLFQLALVDVAPEAVRGDTLVDVVARVRRGPALIANAFGGFFSEGGLTLRGSVTHRNAFEGARQLGVDAEWRSGEPDITILGGQSQRSVTGGPIRDLRFSVPFRQPYVFDRRLSYTLQPSFRQREDEIEASRTFEVSNALLLTLAPLKTAALSVTGRRRDLSRGLGIRLLDAGRFALPPGPFLPDSLRATTGIVSLDVVYGQLDNALQPTRGFVLRPSLALSGGDVTYARARLAASVTVPVRPRIGLVARVTVGAIRPLGDTSSDAVGDYILLRDQLFYAGGTADVRGWAAARLGPKTFSVTPPVQTPGEIPDPSRITSPRDVNYVGVGGQLKGSASVQLNVPLPAGPAVGRQRVPGRRRRRGAGRGGDDRADPGRRRDGRLHARRHPRRRGRPPRRDRRQHPVPHARRVHLARVGHQAQPVLPRPPGPGPGLLRQLDLRRPALRVRRPALLYRRRPGPRRDVGLHRRPPQRLRLQQRRHRGREDVLRAGGRRALAVPHLHRPDVLAAAASRGDLPAVSLVPLPCPPTPPPTPPALPTWTAPPATAPRPPAWGRSRAPASRRRTACGGASGWAWPPPCCW